jgi:hypothetical protein
MPKAFDKWTVFPHRPIEKLEDNVWRVEGDLPAGNGTRVMTIVKLKDGGLLIHSSIALEDDLMKEIEAFGEPKILIVPNGFHRLDAKVFKDRYPKVKVVAPEGARKKVEQVVKVDATYEGAIDDTVRLIHLEGVKNAEGVIEIDHGGEKTIVFNDVVNNLPKLSGMFGFMLAPTGVPAVPRISRWFVIKDTPAFKGHLERLAETPTLKRIIMSHGKPLMNPSEELKSAAARL